MKRLRQSYFIPGMHILVWVLLLGIPALIVRRHNFLGLPPFFFTLTSILHIGIFYLNAYFLYPKLLTRKWWWSYIIALIVVVRITYHIKLFALQAVSDFQLTQENNVVIMFGIMPFLAASIIFRLISDRLKFERLEKEARSEHLASELKFLRSQVSPHFLFNMMTNMVSLARLKSDLLEPSLIRLSELLRYMLYDSAEGKITMAKEMEHIEHYVSLQQLRFGEDVQIHLDIQNDCPNCFVEPMLLIPFIENAFKHGAGMQTDPYINIHISLQQKHLKFNITNNYIATHSSKDKSSGIGLVNVKNRLTLLYPNKYTLKINDENNLFDVVLNIDLS